MRQQKSPQPPPETINILTTNICNAYCKYCEFDCQKTGAALPPAIFEKIYKEGIKIGIKNFVLDGGEFLAHPAANQIIKLIGTYSVKTTILTNGLTFAKFAQNLKTSGVQKVIFGIDSTKPQTNDRIKDKAGITRATLNSINIARGLGFTVGLHAVLTTESCNDFPDFLKFAGQIGASPLLISSPVSLGRAKISQKIMQLNALQKRAIKGAYKTLNKDTRGFFAYREQLAKTSFLESLYSCKYFTGKAAAIDWHGNLCFCGLEPAAGKMPAFSLQKYSLLSAIKKQEDVRRQFLSSLTAADKIKVVDEKHSPCHI